VGIAHATEVRAIRLIDDGPPSVQRAFDVCRLHDSSSLLTANDWPAKRARIVRFGVSQIQSIRPIPVLDVLDGKVLARRRWTGDHFDRGGGRWSRTRRICQRNGDARRDGGSIREPRRSARTLLGEDECMEPRPEKIGEQERGVVGKRACFGRRLHGLRAQPPRELLEFGFCLTEALFDRIGHVTTA